MIFPIVAAFVLGFDLAVSQKAGCTFVEYKNQRYMPNNSGQPLPGKCKGGSEFYSLATYEKFCIAKDPATKTPISCDDRKVYLWQEICGKVGWSYPEEWLKCEPGFECKPAGDKFKRCVKSE